MTITERRRSLVTGGDPDKIYRIPTPGTFVDRAGFETEFIQPDLSGAREAFEQLRLSLG